VLFHSHFSFFGDFGTFWAFLFWTLVVFYERKVTLAVFLPNREKGSHSPKILLRIPLDFPEIPLRINP